VGRNAEIGNFAELKNARLGEGVKQHHMSYLGDADLGAGTNVGAGTITANYDGTAKHRTTVGKRVFLGVDTMLRAPSRSATTRRPARARSSRRTSRRASSPSASRPGSGSPAKPPPDDGAA
jgi:NDP-sugar pyrophosphorylase family protein